MTATPEDIRPLAEASAKAEARIRPFTRETPVEPSPALSASLGWPIAIKMEHQQHTGSFKVRGALNKILALPENSPPVAAASTGNHALGVTHALAASGRSGIVFVPENAAPAKVAALRARGADVRISGRDIDETEALTRAASKREGWVYVSPYNDLEVVAGQGTLGLELLRQTPDISRVFIAVGGGGLIGGVGAVLKTAKPDIEVIGCSPLNSRILAASIEAGRIVEPTHLDTLSDGTAGGVEAGSVTFPICQAVVDRWIDVSEDEIAEA
ncbi:MAG: pyridoxal-phosphate dependent enzyme, partial [Caulobacteraceae bacterium]